MALFDFLFKKAPEPKGEYEGYFKMLTGYQPRFTSFDGGMYEMELIRAAIHTLATHTSKLKVESFGAARPALQGKLRHGPNQFQTWSQFEYRLRTIYENCNTAFITPIYDEYGEPSGIYTPLPSRCDVVQYGKTPYLRYQFSNGEKAAIELAYCGIMTKFQYKSDLFGESNRALEDTMDLIHIQNQGIEEGVKSAATYRFMASLSNFAKPEDLAKERQRFTAENFSKDAKGGGLLLFPNTYQNIKQVDVKPWVVDAEQMKAIKDNVYQYFGVNEDALTSQVYGDKWSAFYESQIESFAIQESEVLTKMFFTLREQTQGNYFMVTANRLQYMSNNDKLNVTAQLLDRGMLTLNEAREIWNLPALEDGDVRVIRGEYYNAGNKVTEGSNET